MKDKKKMKTVILIAAAVSVLLGLLFAAWKIWNVPKPVDGEWEKFDYSRSGTSIESIYSYVIERDEESETGFSVIFYLKCGSEVYRVPADEELIRSVDALIHECELYKWNGFNESNSMVLDGSSFSLRIVYADGSEIYARGNNSFPAGYGEASEKIDVLFNDYMEENRDRLTEVTDE